MRRKVISVREIMARSPKGDAQLAAEERLIVLLADFESLMDMEGWDFFFIHRPAEHYAELKQGLEAVGDAASMEVLLDYEKHLRSHGVSLAGDAINAFLCKQDSEYLRSCRDWRADYMALSQERMSAVKRYLESCGYDLTA